MNYAANSNIRYRPCAGSARGQALVPVIFITVILTTLAIAFATSAGREVRSAGNFAAETDRYYAAHGAVVYAMSAIAQLSNNGATYGMVPAASTTDANGWQQIGDTWVKLDVIDTCGLININTVTTAVLQRIPYFQNNPQIQDAILDWRNPAAQATTDGAESSYYNSLPNPYNANNAPYDTVEEMLLVEGVTPTVLYGTAQGTPVTPYTVYTPITTVSTTAPSTPAATTGTGATAAVGDTDFSDIFGVSTIPLSEMFTTVGMERNLSATGTTRVNINTANATTLESIGLSASLATGIVNYRTQQTSGSGGTTTTGTTKPTTTTTTTTKPGGSKAAEEPGTRQAKTPTPPTTTTKPTTTGATGATGAAATTAFTSIADLMQAPNITAAVMQQIADSISVNSNPYNTNVVDINTASAEVLATVTGIDHATINAILTYRASGAAFQSMNDFFALPGLTKAEFRNCALGLCTKSSFYRVRVMVQRQDQKAPYAYEALVELTDNGPQIVQWREIQRIPGWSLWVPSPVLPQPTAQSATGQTTPSTTTGGS